MTSVNVRKKLVDTLWLDLIGPQNDHPFATELLPEPPTRWYLTGFLVPTEAPVNQRFDETSREEIDGEVDAKGLDDANAPDKAAARRSLLPSSIGLSVLVPGDTKELKVKVAWGDYVYEAPGHEEEPVVGGHEGTDAAQPPSAVEEDAAKYTAGDSPAPATGSDAEPKTGAAVAEGGIAYGKSPRGWRRVPHTENLATPLPAPEGKPARVLVPNSDGLYLVTTCRSAATAGLAGGTRAVSVFLVNYRKPNEEHHYRAFAFQASLELTCAEGFVPRPDPRGWEVEDEWDQRVADLQYRDVCEFAVGHGVSAEADVKGCDPCHVARTTWIPSAEVEHVAPADIPDIELKMEALGALAGGAEAETKLMPMVRRYRDWITNQRTIIPTLTGTRAQTARDMLIEAETVANRIEAGIKLLSEPDVLEAFRMANRAVARSARQRFGRLQGKAPEAIDPPTWYPFQLAFLLMTIRGIVDPAHGEREVVDLLFFPTGGGKTEAYLSLAAFALILRRLKAKGPDGKPSIRSAGVSVLMRYTLRLLTLDQLGRAAALICALELERDKNKALLGEWPFEIGLWVGQAATPNRMGRRGDRDDYSAYIKTSRFMRDDRKPSPIPLEECPWCGTKFNRNSFRLEPNNITPTDLRVRCSDFKCIFSGNRSLPIVAVDEPIYRRLPCFIIATVDKFAALPWTGETGTLMGLVDRYDKDGFYGPCDPRNGTPIPGGHLPAPDLIIQDELHLISGPLGTVAGLYETVIDALSTRQVGDKVIRPKIIASTATVRRADSQIQALFGRRQVRVFPTPGPDRRDSFFAETRPIDKTPARLYVGIAGQGRSLKVVLLRAALALLSAGQTAWEEAGGSKTQPNPADSYMTLLGYFNSLRELGGSRRIVEDEVRTRLSEYGRRCRREPDDRLFRDRTISYDVLELTSRVSTNDVATAKRRLALKFTEKDRVDVALATNMISVGLDILRLGLMVVLGQPKTCAEYIQATSRVGRDPENPGLVVTLLNIHKPRDRSHYERFAAYHASFYRNVEATSVTPFSPRALDRALPASLVALCRHGRSDMTAARNAKEILSNRAELDPMSQVIATRAREHKADMGTPDREKLYAAVLNQSNSLLDDWLRIAKQAQEEGSGLQYQREEASPPRHLLYQFLDPDLPTNPIQRRFRANRSMRDVEAPVELEVKDLNDWEERR